MPPIRFDEDAKTHVHIRLARSLKLNMFVAKRARPTGFFSARSSLSAQV